ncbi:MAG: CHASE domain-containing protein, partial [Gammaproteobacteria bacterium]|nr:CHASE domain-containing protein [Gammaproteobacteria bacterium]
GVFLGSLLLNIWISSENSTVSLLVIVVSSAAAIGASLQALTAAWLVRRFVGYPAPLVKESEILWFMLLAGPVASVINASFGATSLFLGDVINAGEFAFSWFTWWVGDTLGVFITAPLMFILFSQPRALWWSRRHSVAIPLVSMLLIVIFLFVWISQKENERIEYEFQQAASINARKLNASFKRHIDSVASIERFFVSSDRVSRQQFNTFVKNMLTKDSGIHGFGWNPVIKNDQRADFESSIRNSGLGDFQITERNQAGEIIIAKQRQEYVVATYLEPLKSNLKAIGYDVASNPQRNQALIQARDSGQPVATSRITLVQENSNQAGFLLFHPIYQGVHETITQRQKHLRAYTVGIFRVDDIVNTVLTDHFQRDMFLSIYDTTDTNNPSHLYGPIDRKHFNNAQLRLMETINIGGRSWSLNYWPREYFITNHRGWQAWTVLASGLIFTSLLGAFLLATTGRSYHIENLVTQRTAELSGILTTAIEAIITIDQNGLIETINPAGERLFDFTKEELTGHSIEFVIPDFFNHMGDTNLLKITGSRRDSYALQNNQNKIPIELAISELETAEKTIYTVIIHDLTERTKVNQLKDEFISVVSHELRTPLTSIKGSLGLIVGGIVGTIPKKSLDMLKLSYQNVERLELLINDLLDINKIQSIDTQIPTHAICINELVSKAISSNQGYADNYGITLKSKTELDNSLSINANEHMLMQVFSNLLSNAIKYSPKGADVWITSNRHSDYIRITIFDIGTGIPYDFQDSVFEKFTQADSSDTRRVGGTGLGMAITKSIIEKHNGRLDFHSIPGQGTEFYFELPIDQNSDNS